MTDTIREQAERSADPHVDLAVQLRNLRVIARFSLGFVLHLR